MILRRRASDQPLRRDSGRRAARVRKGTNGVSTSGVTANFVFFDRGTFWYSR